MAITEDYVSFEVAKLLKDKGFNEKCNSYFISNNEIALIANKRDFNKHGIYLSAPTLQRAMKWLREVHDIYIDISIYVITKNILKYNIGVYYKKHKNDSMYLGIHLTKECSKYEKAVEVAIKYCLENLIQNNYEED